MSMSWLWTCYPMCNPDRLLRLSCRQLLLVGVLLLPAISPAFAASTHHPEIELNQHVGDVESNSDGTFTVPITLTTRNVGDEKLVNIQLTDDLDIFGSGRMITVSTPKLISGNLALNADFNGRGDTRLLQGTDRLSPGGEARLRFYITFDARGDPGPFANRAVARAEGKYSGKAVKDDVKCNIYLPLRPDASLRKTAGHVTSNGYGTFLVPITLELTNTGPEKLVKVQLKDNLEIFGSGKLVSVDAKEVLAGNASLNPGFDGIDDIRLLDGDDTLPVGSTIKLRFEVTFDPSSYSGPYTNRAIAWAEGKDSGVGVDISASATFSLPLRPEIEYTKTTGTVTNNKNRTYTVPITLDLLNVGLEEIVKLQLKDNLDIFGAGHVVEIGPVEVLNGDLTPNPDFNGLDNIHLLTGVDAVAIGDRVTLRFPVTFDPADEPGPFTNWSIAWTEGKDSGIGIDVGASAEIAVPPEPGIRLEKEAGAVSSNVDGSLSVPITLTVTNTGNEVLDYVQLTDNLNIFGDGELIDVEDLASDDLTVNANFDGDQILTLLEGADSVPPDAEATVTFTVRFYAGAMHGPFINTAIAEGIGEFTGSTVSDSDDAPIELPQVPPPPPQNPVITISKKADRTYVVRGGLVGYDIAVTNMNDAPVADVTVTDIPPAGFQLVEGSVVLIRPGPDGRPDTEDDEDPVSLSATGTGPIEFETFSLEPHERVVVRYLMRVSTGVADGEYLNSVVVVPPAGGPQPTATVTVVGDPMFEKTTLIGRVFEDSITENGLYDAGEPGIPGVRLATVSGLTIETDANGRYHVADVDVDRFERGANFIIKLDTHTLPEGSEVTSENPRVIRLTQATLSKVNFAVKMPGPGPDACIDDCEEERAESAQGENLTATATRIVASGGDFGCNMLVAESLPGILPGRQADGKPDVDSQLTVFAPGISDDLDGTSCRRFIMDLPGGTAEMASKVSQGIRIGHYPIEITTDEGSRLWVTSAGDVIRKGDPGNAEHIIVTPFRDDTNNRIISALRIANDGIEPIPGETSREDAGTSLPASMQTVDPFVTDPRLDVLALNDAVIRDSGNLLGDLSFGLYTNYATDIKAFALEIYGSSEYVSGRTLLDVQYFPDYDDDRLVNYSGIVNCEVDADYDCRAEGGAEVRQRDLSLFTELEYVLKASDCSYSTATEAARSFEEGICHVDATAARRLALRAGDEIPALPHNANELWGKNNLASQNIPVPGGRARSRDPQKTAREISAFQSKPKDLRHVNDRDKGIFVMEEHPGPEATETESDSDQDFEVRFSADAHDITVDGGMFGCGQVVIAELPGRSRLNPPEKITAVTVAADPAGPGAAIDQCPAGVTPGQYPIRVSTGEGTVIFVNSPGDVTPSLPPREDSNNKQQIVVTPFRDYTDSSIVSAMRITNEGFPEVRMQPLPSPPDETMPIRNEYFVVALANLTVGQNNVSGNVLPLSGDDHFDGTTFIDGRVAMYAKGKIQGKYLITAQLDTAEDELGDLGDNLKRKDPRRVFRQLDPDLYYPVYGDDSTTTTDVDTQGALYVRVDWDKNTALWGNYNTGMTDTELMQYNRSLYGARIEHESQGTTRFGDARRELSAFGSEAQSVAAHVTFHATGGSLYYLRDIDIVQGSEKVWIEVRRRDTEQVVERQILLEGRDYEVDDLQGRIILRRPLSQVVNDRENSIIRSSPLEGDEVYLLVDYEYVPTVFAAGDNTYGGRGRVWLGDHIAVGAATVTDERNGGDYEMNGADLTVKLSEKTYLRAEVAHSRARQSDASFISIDGGLTFQPQISSDPGEDLDGGAIALDLQVDLAEFSEKLQGDVRAWWKERDAGFSTGRIGQGEEIVDGGIEVHAKVGQDLDVSASYTDFERKDLSRERVARVQVQDTFGMDDKFTAGVELRHERVETLASGPSAPVSGLLGATGDGEALLIGARLGYDINDDTTVYAAAQTVADDNGIYRANDLASVGFNRKVSQGVAMSLEASDGDRGSAITSGVSIATNNGLNFNVSGGVGSGAISQFSSSYEIAEGHKLYGSYAVDPDRTDGARNLLTLGQRRSFGNSMAIFTESQFGKDDRYANVAHIFGLNFEGTEDWRYSATVQFSDNDFQGLAFDRQALSLGAYRDRGDLKISSRVELREDEGAGIHTRQYVSSNSFTRIVDEGSRWLGKLNLSWTDDRINGGHDARFTELDIGYAYRPVESDRLNLIGKYSFLYDLPTEGQATTRPDERSHLISVEGIYDLDSRWELAGKLAVRKGDRRLSRDSGPWEEFGLRLASARARLHINKEWDGLLEYRWLSDITGDNDREGALIAAYRHLNDHLKVGVGFNFTDFDDRLRIDSYQGRGWFLDLVGKY